MVLSLENVLKMLDKNLNELDSSWWLEDFLDQEIRITWEEEGHKDGIITEDIGSFGIFEEFEGIKEGDIGFLVSIGFQREMGEWRVECTVIDFCVKGQKILSVEGSTLGVLDESGADTSGIYDSREDVYEPYDVDYASPSEAVNDLAKVLKKFEPKLKTYNKMSKIEKDEIQEKFKHNQMRINEIQVKISDITTKIRTLDEKVENFETELFNIQDIQLLP